MSRTIQPLTFDMVDDIRLALEAGGIEEAQLPAVRAIALGPLVELRHGRVDGFANDSWLDRGNYCDLTVRLNIEQSWHRSGAEPQGCIAISSKERDDLAWIGYSQRAKRAATSVGFSDDYAGKLVAAIGELYSNVLEHSERPHSGYMAYAARRGCFEFIVADAGVGVLESLRRNPMYSALVDAGKALELALSEGVSRHYDERGHGFGFKPLFIGLANISRRIRFRSCDHGRTVERARDGELQTRTVQTSKLDGFLCSVECEI